MKKYSLIGLGILSLTALSGCEVYPTQESYSEPYHPAPMPAPVYDSYVEAPVVSANPVYTQVAIRRPVQHCWQQQNPSVSVGGSLIGGLAGGLLGHTVGRGGGNVAATAGGAVIGAVVGNDIATQNQAPGYTERCETEYEVSYQPQITSYDVSYSLNGRVYNTNVPYNPGSTIRVRNTVRPVY